MPIFFTKTTKLSIIFILCFLLASCGEKEVISTKDMDEANKMIVALNEGGINASRTPEGEGEKIVYKVMVDDGFFSTGALLESMRILQDNCLPPKLPPPIAESGFGGSSMAELEKKKRQAQIDLNQLFRSYYGVTCVTSMIVYPEKSIDSYKPYSSSASIKITFKSQNAELTKEAVQMQTARAIEKLDPANVDVRLEYVEVKPANLNSADSWKKMLITIGAAVALIAILMFIILWMRSRKTNEEEFDDETELIEENELNLLESGEEE
jgi:type III secretory pathway lipoprotein EscJ